VWQVTAAEADAFEMGDNAGRTLGRGSGVNVSRRGERHLVTGKSDLHGESTDDDYVFSDRM
jgi:hypothetical protein